MMYDFDEIIPRKGTNSIKWDANPYDDILPLWVADMDFKTAPPIIDALATRVQHGVFGYAKAPASFYDSIQKWFAVRYGFSIESTWILNTIGVVPAIYAIIKTFTKPGDKVLLQGPVYNCFYSTIENNGCTFVSNDLMYNNGAYQMDYEDLEEKASDPNVKLLILCNPHNPVGRSWTKEELTRLGDICIRNNVLVVSDEIHCDFVYSPHIHVPFASISDDFLQHSITCIAPSKTFNLAGLQVSNIIIADENIRNRVNNSLIKNEIGGIGPFGIDALIAAYNEGENWLDELKVYLQENYEYLKNFFEENLPQLKILPLEATYLVWVDCKSLGMPSKLLTQDILEKIHVRFNPGTQYGAAGEGFIRINIACPKEILRQALERFKSLLLDSK